MRKNYWPTLRRAHPPEDGYPEFLSAGFTGALQMYSNSELVDQYLRRGYSIIPLQPGTKKPSINDWSRFCRELPLRNEVIAWQSTHNDAGIGLACGPASNIVCFDLDLDLGIESDQAIYEEIRDLLPASPVEKVGSKGFTRFFQYSGEVSWQCRHGGKVIFEILSIGRQTVLPPSIHPNTQRSYQWTGVVALQDIPSEELPVLDRAVLDKLKTVISKLPIPNGAHISSGRNDSLKMQAVAAIKHGKIDTDVINELLTYDNTHHSPPLFSDPDDPQMKGSTRQANAQRFVENIRASVGEPVVKVSSLNLISIKELIAQPCEETSWLIKGLLPTAGTSMLAAKPKVGKTTLSRQLAVCVAKGLPFLGRETVPGRVAYIALEEKNDEVKKHFLALGVDDQCEIDVTTDVTGDAFAALEAYVRVVKPRLVIIDPIFRFIKIQDGNNYNAVTAALEPFSKLARSSGTHILMIHHRGKGDKSGGDSILGSTAIFAAFDTALTMNKTDARRTIKSEQRYGEGLEETVLIFDPEQRSLSFGKTSAESKSEEMGESIRTYLTDQITPIEEKSITEAVGGTTAICRQVIRELVDSGGVRRSGAGKKGDPYKYFIEQQKGTHKVLEKGVSAEDVS
jgi:hypothetical protein